MPIDQLLAHSLNEKIVREIKAEMARQGINQSELGELVGRTQNAISRRLTGKVQFSMGEIEEIAQALDVTVDQLIPRAKSRRAS